MNVYTKHNRDLFIEKEGSLQVNDFIANLGYRCVKCGKYVSPAIVQFYKSRFESVRVNEFGTKEVVKVTDGFCELIRCYDCQSIFEKKGGEDNG